MHTVMRHHLFNPEHNGNCITVVVLLALAMVLLGVMHGMTTEKLARYRHNKPPVLVLPEGFRRQMLVDETVKRNATVNFTAS